MGFKRKYNVNERRCKDKSSNNEGGNYKPLKKNRIKKHLNFKFK